MPKQVLPDVDNVSHEAIDAAERDRRRASVREDLIEGLRDAAQVEVRREELRWHAGTSRAIHLTVVAFPGVVVSKDLHLDGLSAGPNVLAVRALGKSHRGKVRVNAQSSFAQVMRRSVG